MRTKYVAPARTAGTFVIIPELCDRVACGDVCLSKCKFNAIGVRD